MHAKAASVAALTASLALAACQSDEPPPAPPPPTITTPAPPGTCAVIESREWHAWVNAMPGPQATQTLIVTGEIVLPTPGYKIALTAGAADRSATPVQQLILTLTPPAGPVPQVLHPEQVRYEGPAISRQYRAIRIMCDGQMLTEIDDVPVAR